MTPAEIAVVGGTGRLGSAVVADLRRRGHAPRVLGRSSPEHPVDLRTGAGLGAALAGVDVVVDAANDASPSSPTALADATRRLLAAERAAGVVHHVEIGVLGSERVPLGYYRAKREQELAACNGPVPWTLVRATQFHEFVAWAFSVAARKHVLPGGRVPLQPVAVAEVACAVADACTRGAQGRTVTVAGPRVERLGDLARAWRTATGARAIVLPVPGVTGAARALRAGALTAGDPDILGRETFGSWLDTHV